MDNYRPRLEALYHEKFRSSMKDQFKYKNDLMIPKLEKADCASTCAREQ